MTLEIIDSHQHLWDLNQLSLPWVKDIPELNRSFGCQDYREYTSPDPASDLNFEINQSIYLEVDADEIDIRKETDLILELCRDQSNPLAAMIASCRPGASDFQASLDFAITNPEIKGFRRVLHTEATPPKTCLKHNFLSSISSLAAHNLTFDLCMRRDELRDAVELANRCPETLLVLDHCGNADSRMTMDEFSMWESDIRSLAQCENVVCKVSGFIWTIQNPDWRYETEIEPILRVVFETFGENRVLFGGDWPVCTLSQLSFAQWIAALYQFATSFGEQTADKLFRTNAQRTYRL